MRSGGGSAERYSNSFSGATVRRYAISVEPSATSSKQWQTGQRNSAACPLRELSSMRRKPALHSGQMMSPFLMHPIMPALYHRSTTAAVFNRRPRTRSLFARDRNFCSRRRTTDATKSIGKFEASRNRRRVAALVGDKKKFTCVMVEADAMRQAFPKLIRDLRSTHTEDLT